MTTTAPNYPPASPSPWAGPLALLAAGALLLATPFLFGCGSTSNFTPPASSASMQRTVEQPRAIKRSVTEIEVVAPPPLAAPALPPALLAAPPSPAAAPAPPSPPAAGKGGDTAGAQRLPPGVLAAVLATLSFQDPPPASAVTHTAAGGGLVVSAGGNQVAVPDGARVKVRTETTEETYGGGSKEAQDASGTGTGLETNSDDTAQKFKSTSPNASLKGVGGAEGGAFSYTGTLTGGHALNVLTIFGAVLLAAGVAIYIWFPLIRRLAPPVATGGAVLIVIGVSVESAPWIWYLAIPVGVGAVALLILYANHHAKESSEKGVALGEIVHAVDGADPIVKEEIKAEIKSTAKEHLPIVDKWVDNAKKLKGI